MHFLLRAAQYTETAGIDRVLPLTSGLQDLFASFEKKEESSKERPA